MGTEDVYFQFPIRALNMGKNIDEVNEDEAACRSGDIAKYCLVDFGTKNSMKAGYGHTLQVAANYIENRRINPDCDSKKPIAAKLQALVFFAADRLKVNWNDSNADVADVFERHRFIDGLSGGNMHIRLRRDIFWDLSRGALSWREWSILCGIYAMLGNRPKVRLCYKQINALALGFNGVTQIGSKLEELTMTPRQTQITVDKLVGRNLLSKACVNYRHIWYSHKPQRELETMVIDSEVLKQKKLLDAKSSEATARGRAEVLRQLELYNRASAKAQLAEMKANSKRLGKA